MEVLVTGEQWPSEIAVDADYVYWVAGGRSLRRAPHAGGKAETLAKGLILQHIAVGGDYVYFTDSAAGSLSRVARGGGPTQIVAIADAPFTLALAEGAVYWTESGHSPYGGSISVAALDGSTQSVVASGLESPGGLVVRGDWLYFTELGQVCFDVPGDAIDCFGGGVARLPRGGGRVESIATGGRPLELVADERALYWVGEGERLMSAPLAGSPRDVGRMPRESGPLALDSSALYHGTDTEVLRWPLAGGPPVRLAADLQAVSGLAVYRDWVYVSEHAAGRIVRVATDGSADRVAGPITGPCPDPLGSAEEIASTPRADENLERLALSLEPARVTASQDAYERVVADMAAIRALAPELRETSFFPPNDGKTLFLLLTSVARQTIQAGEYSAWDCLNDIYGLRSVQLHEDPYGDSARLELKGIYNVRALAALYAELPGVKNARAEFEVGDGPTLCVSRSGTDYEYVVGRRGRDCPSRCTSEEAHQIASGSAGLLQALGIWESTDDRFSEQPPERFTRDCPSGCAGQEAHHFASRSAGQVRALEVWESTDDRFSEPPEWFTRLCY